MLASRQSTEIELPDSLAEGHTLNYKGITLFACLPFSPKTVQRALDEIAIQTPLMTGRNRIGMVAITIPKESTMYGADGMYFPSNGDNPSDVGLNSSLLPSAKRLSITAFHEGAHGVYASNSFRVQQRLRPLFDRAYKAYGKEAPDSLAWPASSGKGALPTPLTILESLNYERMDGIHFPIAIRVVNDAELFAFGASTLREYPHEFLAQMRRLNVESPKRYGESLDIAHEIVRAYGNHMSAIFQPALLKFLKENRPRKR
ncbi:MAG: hypothetical protein V1708_00545 [Candidatus Micrarchaeota archaeon]